MAAPKTTATATELRGGSFVLQPAEIPPHTWLTTARVEALAAAYSAKSQALGEQAQRYRLRGRRPEEVAALEAESRWCAKCADDISALLKPVPGPSATYCPQAKVHELIDERTRGGKYECRLCHWEPEVE
jgi:hypothetical protein